MTLYRKTVDLLNKYNLRAKKKFGQNFLVDSNVLDKIVDGADLSKDDTVIEVGPGLGFLTEKLMEHSKKVIAYEIDDNMVRVLSERFLGAQTLEIIKEDILKVDLSLIDEEVTVVANLPYYITTPILFRFLESRMRIKKLVLMMQKEVADRIVGTKSTKDYNALSVVLQYYGKTRLLTNVSREAFLPKPNVDSAVIVLEVYKKPIYEVEEEWFFKLVKASFAQRRKTLANNLQVIGIKKDDIYALLSELGLNERSRAEALDIDDFVYISNKIKGEV